MTISIIQPLSVLLGGGVWQEVIVQNNIDIYFGQRQNKLALNPNMHSFLKPILLRERGGDAGGNN